MSHKFVRTIEQDKDDFMWFGSSEGLDRFDGHHLLSFYHDSEIPNSLSSNVISRILIDKKDNLWVGTFGGGLNLYQEDSQDFVHFTTTTKYASLTNDTVNALLEDSNGKLWVGTDNGLNILSTDTGEISVNKIFQELGNPNSLSHNTIHSIIETSNHQVWVGTNGGGISIFDINGSFIRAVRYQDTNSSTYINKFINSLYQDKQNNIWIGTVDNGLLKFNTTTESYIHYQFNSDDNTSLSSNTVISIFQDSKLNTWIATDNGLSIYRTDSDDFKRLNHSASNPYSLSSDYILTFFEDSEHMMWVGTFTGVNRWDPNMTVFSQYSGKTHPEILNNNITSFTQSAEQKIIFSTYSGGLYQLSLKTNVVLPLPFNQYFANHRIMTLFAEGDTLWVGTRASGLYEVNLNTKAIKSYKNIPNVKDSLSANSVTDIIRDTTGNLWVSTFNLGLNKLNQDGTFKRFVKRDDFIEKGPSSNHILQLLEDEQGDIWLATYGGGLNRFDWKANSFSHIRHIDGDTSSLSSDLAWIMLLDNMNNLWVGTQAAGINKLSYEKMRNKDYSFEHLDTKDGMKSNTVYAMEEDRFGDIWFSSNKGVSRFSTGSDSFKHYDLNHGLVDIEYNHGSAFKASDGTIYFGSGKGATSVDPQNINNNRLAPKVRLTSILNLNEPMVFNRSLSSLTNLELNYDDQLISFEYVGLNYVNPESTRYKYRLLGFDQAWIDAGKSRRVSYSNLPAGNYQLQIQAGNSDNVWSDPGLSLDIVVKPAPWNTWWAYILYTLAVALVLLFYSRFLNRKLVIEQQQKLYLEQQVQEKTEKFKSKNLELAQANKQLEKAAIVDKVTGVKSRRYLDIYIEQTSQLMNQMHQNLLPVQRDMLPRLYILMVQLKSTEDISNSQLINLTDLLLYSRNNDDLVIRWSNDTFAVIGYEKGNNANDLAARLSARLKSVVDDSTSMNMAYSFFPFSRENPLDLTWDQISVLIEQALTFTDESKQLSWLGLCGPKSNSFDYLQLMQQRDLVNLKEQVIVKSGLS